MYLLPGSIRNCNGPRKQQSCAPGRSTQPRAELNKKHGRKKTPVYRTGVQEAFLLSHIRHPLREEKREAVARQP